AEEEAARRLNTGRGGGNWTFSGANSRAKRSDLFGPVVLRDQADQAGKEHGMTFDLDAMNFVAVAAESRIRAIIQSSIHAQQHRASTSHLHAPPLSSTGKPLWSHAIRSNPNAVMEALTRQNRDAEQTFRATRMDRLARETELARVRDRAEQSNEESGPSTPRADGTPTFGAGGTADKKRNTKKSARDVSAEVQIKMSNATALRQAGGRKQYAWMTNAPAISSNLKPKKAKTEEPTRVEATEPVTSEENIPEKGGIVKGKKKRKIAADVPEVTRRSVVVAKDQNGEKKVPDDKALTVVDLLWAMERDSGSKGVGSVDEVVQRMYARPGGPWGMEEPTTSQEPKKL
ncbi:hypothetical protein TREMEDRAFT_31230, partial [Tremella mesenterica DSM 1558]|uniref:uncharacterized protein n=1 Tax=Tremella mesenterica (strain ATCC 24925 / CBS 8224 / DSM 1558 / NBRC 9311 / NRRL Y-6157 / RJB 2259-6 / UBC 559-6) TaxID=578456 RepID=UPI0003F48EB1